MPSPQRIALYIDRALHQKLTMLASAENRTLKGCTTHHLEAAIRAFNNQPNQA